MRPLLKEQKRITDKYSRARDMKKKLNDKIEQFKKDRRKDGDGIEAEMFSILKKQFNVTIQAYHGGSLTGKDIQIVMENASDIFSKFAVVLKSKKRNDGMDDTEIDSLCLRCADLSVLWDGAFSYASKLDPTNEDIATYERFVNAAVNWHVQFGCNVTPKVCEGNHKFCVYC